MSTWNYTNKPVEQILLPLTQLREKFQKLVDDYGVRKIIEDARNKIKNAYPTLDFKEETHQYFYKGIELIPVSNFCSLFEPVTDFDKVAANYALKNGKTGPWWRNVWKLKADISTTAGSLTHLYGETLTKAIWNEQLDNKFLDIFEQNNYVLPLYPKQVAIVKFFEDLYNNLVIPVAAECKLIIEDEISGTFDLLGYSIRDKAFILLDYKTNAELKKTFQKQMLHLYSTLNDEPLSHYIIQQNLYRIGLKDIGIEAKQAALVWLKDNETYQLVAIPNDEKRTREAIDFMKNMP